MKIPSISVCAVAAVLLALGCATNPVTQQRELSTMSPEREAALGAEAARAVEEGIGLVHDPALGAYVAAIGQRLAAHSPRRDVEYRFLVADMEVPNAFALPGGWIYVSRGLLLIANSEAELANVIGHEVGHVAARHASSREARSLGVGLLSVLGAVVSTATLGADLGMGRLFQIAGAGAIASYSRKQERQADDVGQSLAAASGWDPDGMPRFLATLDAGSRSETEESEVPSFFDSHPVTAERVRDTRERARQLQNERVAAPPIAPTRAAFLAKLEGLLVGPDPRHGVFHGSRFLHPELRIAIDFPAGWETHNGDSVVAAVSEDGNALSALQAQQAGDDPLDAARRFSEAHSLPLADPRAETIAGHPAFRAVAMARTREGPLGLDLCWIAYQGVIFRITGMSSADRFARFAPTFAAVAASFSFLTDRELATIRELRLQLVRARAGESLAALSRRTGNALSLAETATANGLSPDARLAAGDLIKVAIPRPRRSD